MGIVKKYNVENTFNPGFLHRAGIPLPANFTYERQLRLLVKIWKLKCGIMTAIVKNEMSDVKLVKGFQRGDKRMAEMLFARFCSGLVYFCMQYLRNQQLVDKIVADCFVGAWNKRKEFCDLSSLKMFLYKTARSACSDYQAVMNNRLRWQGEIDRLSGKYECLFADRHMIIGELMNKNLLNVYRLRVLQKKIYRSGRKEKEP